MPKLVLAWKNGGGPGLWHEAIRNTALIAALMLPFQFCGLSGGRTVMQFLFHGKEFEGHGHTLTVLALATSAGALGMPASIALAAMEASSRDRYRWLLEWFSLYSSSGY